MNNQLKIRILDGRRIWKIKLTNSNNSYNGYNNCNDYNRLLLSKTLFDILINAVPERKQERENYYLYVIHEDIYDKNGKKMSMTTPLKYMDFLDNKIYLFTSNAVNCNKINK